MVDHLETEKCYNSTQNCLFSRNPKPEWSEFRARSFPETSQTMSLHVFVCFLLVSLNLLSLIFLLIPATGAVRVLRSYDAWELRGCNEKGFIYFAKSQRTSYVEEITSQGGKIRVGTRTGAFSEGLATSPCSASSIDRPVVVLRERAIVPL